MERGEETNEQDLKFREEWGRVSKTVVRTDHGYVRSTSLSSACSITGSALVGGCPVPNGAEELLPEGHERLSVEGQLHGAP